MQKKSIIGLAGAAGAAIVAAAVAIPSFSPETDQSRTLGSPETRWGTAYTAEINDGQGNALNVAETAQYIAAKDHSALKPASRAAANSHPIAAITGLSGILQPATQASDGLMSAADKAKIDNADFDGFVKHTIAGDIQLPQGKAYLGTDGGSNAVSLARVDANNDAAFGDVDHFSRLYSSGRPFVLTPNPDDPDAPLQDNMAYTSDIDDVVRYDAAQGITLSAGSGISVEIPGTFDPDTGEEITPAVTNPIYQTDALGNVHLGNASAEWNITAIQRPTIQIGGGAPVGIGLLTDLDTFVSEDDLATKLAAKADLVSGTVPYAQLPADLSTAVTEAALAEEMAYKADLVDGVIPDSQIPSHVKVNSLGPVPTADDLVTLTDATLNDRAFVGTKNPYETYYLRALPPTDSASWIQASSTGGGGTITAVNGDTGPVVNIDLPQLPLTQNALNDKADASSLASYATLGTAQTFTGAKIFSGTINVPTVAQTTNSTAAASTSWTTTKLASYALLASPNLTGLPTTPTPATTANSTQIVNASWTNTRLGSYLPLAGGTMLGNITMPATGSILFGAGVGEKLSLYGSGTSGYNLGIESSTLYYRTGGQHKWYSGTTSLGYWNATDLYVKDIPITGTLAAKANSAIMINTLAPLTGGGDHTANRTLAISAATSATATAAGAAGSVVYAPDNAASTVRNQAVTPAGLAAAFVSPNLSGTPTSTTASPGTATKQIATTEFVQNAVGNASGTVSLKSTRGATVTGTWTIDNLTIGKPVYFSVSNGGDGMTQYNVVGSNTAFIIMGTYVSHWAAGATEVIIPTSTTLALTYAVHVGSAGTVYCYQ